MEQKYKVGDRITVPHVGKCEVLMVKDGVYVVSHDGAVFSVSNAELKEAAHD